MAQVWPGRIVEENNLQVQIAALRKASADERELVRTVAGRGYQFTGTVRTGTPADSGTTAPTAALTNLPEAVSDLIGRDAESRKISTCKRAAVRDSDGCRRHRQDRLGIEAARRLLPKFPDGVWLAELRALPILKLVPVTVATRLGLEFVTGDPSPQQVAAALVSKRLLLILDNCEHVIDATARIAEAVLARARACVLATSREPLRAEGELVYRVPSLDVPAQEMADREHCCSRRHEAVPGANARAATRTFDRHAHCCDGRDLPAARWHPAGDRAGRGARRSVGVEALAARLDDRFACSPEVTAPRSRGTRRCARPWIGATSCCPQPSA